MNLHLKRFEYGTNYTIGRLDINGVYECYTLEDKVREIVGVPVDQWKVQGSTAIPVGTYTVIMDYSNRFNKDMAHVLNVPGFEGIRIHAGNTDADTEGCILVGKRWPGGDFIGNSKLALQELMEHIERALSAGEVVTLTVEG